MFISRAESSSNSKTHYAHSFMMRFADVLDRWFEVSERGSTIGREIQAGFVTFAAVSYIIVVNPTILGAAGIDLALTAKATIISSCLLTLGLALFANVPFAAGPADEACACCFAAGALLCLVTASGLTEHLLNAVPTCQKRAVVVGIGLFQTLVGLLAAGLVRPGTFSVLKLGDLSHSSKPWQAVATLMIIATLVIWRVPAAVLLGITASLTIAWCAGTLRYSTKSSIDWRASNLVDLASHLDMSVLTARVAPVLITLVFLIIFIDTAGAATGLAIQTGPPLMSSNGDVVNLKRVFLLEGVGQMIAACLGTSPPVIYLEAAAGISQGGKTGLTALMTAFLFAVSSVLLPIVQLVPPTATAPVMVLVGCFMMNAVMGIDWQNLEQALPAFLTISVTTFTCSICNGLLTGLFFSFVLNAPKTLYRKWSQRFVERVPSGLDGPDGKFMPLAGL